MPVCAPFQGYNDYNPKFPKLAAAPGDYVSGLYTENGHITLPLKDASGAVIGMPGTMFWYGTTEVGLAPMLADVIAWTADGKGGNGKGKLLSGPTSYDDGVCAEDNPSPISAARGAQGKASIPCHSNFKLPESLKDGSTYTVYWVWDFSLKAGPGKDGKGDGHVEWYTSCMDIDIKGGPVVPASVAGGVTVGNKTLRSNRSVGGARLARLRRKVDFLH